MRESTAVRLHATETFQGMAKRARPDRAAWARVDPRKNPEIDFTLKNRRADLVVSAEGIALQPNH